MGTVAIIYNKDMVDEEDLGGWDILWNKKYDGQILMFDNSRDAIGVGTEYLGYSYNTTDEDQIRGSGGNAEKAETAGSGLCHGSDFR